MQSRRIKRHKISLESQFALDIHNGGKFDRLFFNNMGEQIIQICQFAFKRFGSRKIQQFVGDVGVIGDEPLPVKVFYEIDDMLENLPTLYRIDWVDLNNAAPSLRERALANAEVIYE